MYRSAEWNLIEYMTMKPFTNSNVGWYTLTLYLIHYNTFWCIYRIYLQAIIVVDRPISDPANL